MNQPNTLPMSGVLPTRDRAEVLQRTLQSLAGQGPLPAEIIVVDASSDSRSREVVQEFSSVVAVLNCRVAWHAAEQAGAAAQRNQGVAAATQPFVLFFDDDVLFETGCLTRLWGALQSDSGLGGVNAMITNESYHPPGFISRSLFRVLAGKNEASFAGRVLGPGVNLLPEDDARLPEVVTVDWLNLGATVYRREVLPSPPFRSDFVGYSLMEDLALSLTVGKRWKLANVRTARIFHDSQPGEHKRKIGALNRMELVNRHRVMTEVLNRRSISDHARLLLWEMFLLTVCAIKERGSAKFWQSLGGKILGLRDILRGRIARVSS